jgi:large subunit ribosomal protein L40
MFLHKNNYTQRILPSLCRMQSRLFASKMIVSTPGAKRKVDSTLMGDKRYQTIKDMLYGPNSPAVDAALEAKSPQSQMKLQSQEEVDDWNRKEIIERVWCLLKMREEEERKATLEAKYRSMRAAMEELERTDKNLFEGTKRQKDAFGRPEMILFPRNLRVPTESPPKITSK